MFSSGWKSWALVGNSLTSLGGGENFVISCGHDCRNAEVDRETINGYGIACHACCCLWGCCGRAGKLFIIHVALVVVIHFKALNIYCICGGPANSDSAFYGKQLGGNQKKMRFRIIRDNFFM